MTEEGDRKKGIYIWGTGNNACIFMRGFQVFLSCRYGGWKDTWEKDVCGFVDSNPDKAGKIVFGKMIYSPEHIQTENTRLCIITVKENSSILNSLFAKGFVQDQVIYWSDYIKKCMEEAIRDKEDILSYAGITGIEEEISSHEYFSKLNRFTETTGDMLAERLAYNKFFTNYEHVDSCWFNQMCEADSYERVVDRLHWSFGDDVDKAFQTVEDTASDLKHSKKITTIGIYVDRYYGGGIEKVISLLLPGYLKRGYRIVLITEESGKKEYLIPQGADCYRLKTKHDGCLEERLAQFGECIRQFDIDVICFHSGYARVNLFYELLYMRLKGLYTICVIHSAFVALVKDQPDISSMFIYAYRMADKVVTVSEADCFFWKSLGCNCRFIPNPIEEFPISDSNALGNDSPVILWVGRIVQRPKMVCDVVPIMTEVRNHIKNARLKIVGGKDNTHDYKRLVALIEEHDLKDCIEICEYESQIGEFYEEADVVLITSASESHSNVLAEAGAYGRPVVMYDLPWLPLLSRNEGVLRVKQRDTLGAAHEIVRLLEDEDLWRKCSAAGRDRIRHAAERDVSDDWQNLFESLCGSTDAEAKKDVSGADIVMELFLEQLCGKGYPYDEESGWRK